jgi:hypothetical protein
VALLVLKSQNESGILMLGGILDHVEERGVLKIKEREIKYCTTLLM